MKQCWKRYTILGIVCYIGMMIIAVLYGKNVIGDWVATTIWYCGIGIPLILLIKIDDTQIQKKED